MASSRLPQVVTAFGTLKRCFVEMRFPSRPRALGLIGYTAYTGRGGPCLWFQLIFSYAASLKLA